jgi:hypothetical protein
MKPNRPELGNRSNRPRRSAVGGAGAGGILNVVGDLDPNYNYRFVNDEGSRLDEMKGYGYDIDTSSNIRIGSNNPTQSGSTHSVVVDKGTGKKGVLMRQPKKYHEEDKKLRAEAIDKSEESMFRNLKTEEGRYGEVESTNSLARKIET